jgi:hypothetical protein
MTLPTALAAPVDDGMMFHRLLRGGRRVHGRHEAALDAEVVVEDLGERREAVRRTGGVRDDVLTGVLVVVHAHHEHRRVVLRRSRENDLLRAGGEVLARAVLVEEDAGRLDHRGGAHRAPGELRRIGLGGAADGLAVDDELTVLDLDRALEATVDGVVLQHVGEVVDLEQIVDRDDVDVTALDGGAEDHASDAAEAIDTDLDRHVY